MNVPIVPVVSKIFRRSGRSYGNATQTIANNPDDLDRSDRVEFYWDDHVNFKSDHMETLSDDRDDRRLSQKSSLFFQISRINSARMALKPKK